MSRRRAKPPAPVSAAALQRKAAWYVERYGGNSAALRRVLQRKVAQASAFHETDQTQATALVESTVARFRDLGLVDDDAWALARARRWLRRGVPSRAIRGRLKAAGIAEPQIAAALEALRAQGSPDLRAAVAYARRRRFGPYAPDEKRAAQRQRQLAAMGRAGFSWSVAVRVLDASDIDELEA